MNTFTKHSYTRLREYHGRRGRKNGKSQQTREFTVIVSSRNNTQNLTETTAQMWAEQGWHKRTCQSGRGNIHGGLGAIERTREELEATDGGFPQGRTCELVV